MQCPVAALFKFAVQIERKKKRRSVSRSFEGGVGRAPVIRITVER